MTTASTKVEKTKRMHHLDFLRAMMLLLVVPSHAGNIYETGSEWVVKSQETSTLVLMLQSFAIFSMPGFFTISAMLTIFLLRTRDHNEWVKGRLIRVGIPLATCVLILSPIMIYFASRAVALGADFGMSNQFTGNLEEDFSIVDRRWIGHLWFLITMGIFTTMAWMMLALGVLHKTLRGCANGLLKLNTHMPVWWVLIIGYATWRFGVRGLFYVLKGWLGYEPTIIALLNMNTIFAFFPIYMFGMVLAVNPELRAQMFRTNRLRLAVTVVLFLAYVFTAPVEGFVWQSARMWLQFGLGLAITLLLIGGLERYFTKPNPRISAISKQSYAVYLFHYPIVHIIGFYLLFVSINPFFEYLIAFSLTLALSFAVAVGVNRVPFLRLLFTGEPMNKAGGVGPKKLALQRRS